MVGAQRKSQFPPQPLGSSRCQAPAGVLWVASAGQEVAEIGTQSGSCNTLPASITTCNKASFTTAGFNITASMLFSGGNPSRLAALPNVTNPPLPGVALTVDCSLPAAATVCGVSTSTSVSIHRVSIQRNGSAGRHLPVRSVCDWDVGSGDVDRYRGDPNREWCRRRRAAQPQRTQRRPPRAAPTPSRRPSAASPARPTVNVAEPAPSFLGYWEGSYSITDSLTPPVTASGTDTTFPINQSGSGLSFGFLCASPGLQATQTSATTFTIVNSTCGLAVTPPGCPGATLTLTGGTGTLTYSATIANYVLTLTDLQGTSNGLFGTPCSEQTGFTGGTFTGNPD